MSNHSRISIRTFGRFTIATVEGKDITPRSQKARGIIALLLDAPRMTLTRAALQDKLWSDRGQQQGAASLRQALTEIRKAINVDQEVLWSDATMLGLHPELISVDASHDEGEEYLASIRIRDPEWEDWVRDARQAIADLPRAAPQGASAGAAGRDGAGAAAPTLVVRDGNGAGPLAQHIMHAIAKGVADWTAIDLRDSVPLFDGASGNLYLLQGQEQSDAQGAMLRISLTQSASGLVCWQITTQVSRNGEVPFDLVIARIINQGIDRTIHELASRNVLPAQKGGFSTNVIQRMFRQQGEPYDSLCQSFEEAYERTGGGIHLAWRAFMTTYAVGELRGGDLPGLREEAREFVRRAVEADAHGAVTLALCAHVHSFTLGECDVGYELARRSVQLDPGTPFGWAFLGVAQLYLGHTKEGHDSITRACAIAGEGPHRYLLDFLRCMSAMLSGKFDDAVRIGSTIRVFAPDYAPTERYLLATHIARGDIPAAEEASRRLRRIEPGFELAQFADPAYPVPALRNAKILDLRRLPKLL